jgi:hypothetical protein
MNDGPLSARVSKYIVDGNHDATPDEILRECDLVESRREQVEHYCAVTRYGIFNDREANDADDLAFNDVEWSDVARWDVSPRDREE